jgi:hypothetical protein
MNLSAADKQLLTRQLTDLSHAVEEMLLIGLTAATETTRQTLDVTFREASRMRLLRLASTLRAANEEIGRMIGGQAEFSGRRLSFFLNRSWLLSQGLLHALKAGDEAQFSRLLWMQPSRPVEKIDVVSLGVSKKVAQGSFCAFEFRLRRIPSGDGDTMTPLRLSWSCIFPLKADNEMPAEGFLKLPQKQKFKTDIFLEPRVLTMTNVMVAEDQSGGGRVTLTDASTVSAGETFTDWSRFLSWSATPLLHRVQKHETSPLDLEVELQDEIVLIDWSVDAKLDKDREGQSVYPVQSGAMQFEAIASAGSDGTTLRQQLEAFNAARQRPPLFGLLHFERARFILQPLSTIAASGPQFLTISTEAVDSKTLLKSLKFN